MSRPSTEKITLEDLLRLKRAERPPAEFWVQFEQELHAKQLAALVEKKSRWNLSIRRLIRFAFVPLGGTAALALALTLAQEYRPSLARSRPVAKAMVAIRTVAPHPEAARPRVTPASLQPSLPVAQAAPESTAVHPDRSATEHVASVSSAPSVSREMSTVAWLADALQSAGIQSPRSITTAGLALAQMTQFSDPASLRGALESTTGFKVRPVADPLAQIAAPGEARHARILAALTDNRLVNATEPSTFSRSRERIASRLGSEGFASDDISRLGVEGTQVSFKF